ncbi:MAG: VpsF family polysaccharide biosynthesis protein [Bradyrhizobium sp.]|nr:VpsF family polysaccharide biosynthesis protein [Pseudomonadota bacterium]MDE2473352.1 VpsF family polysaccharide biosynthesis protein [Bradyrhizobium sp.]
MPFTPARSAETAVRPAALIQLVNAAIAGLMSLAVLSIFTISSALLTSWKIHYITSGGGFYEKFHPATYWVLAALFLWAIRNGDPIGDLGRMLSEAPWLLFYLVCWAWLLVQMIATKQPFTAIIDTFLLPLLFCLVIWQLSPQQKKPILWVLHLSILINIVIGYYEYFSGYRLIPLSLGDVVILGEWRSSALLGHPLTASGVVAAYVIALVFRAAICPPIILRLPLIVFSLASLMVFGGRTSLVTVLVILSGTAVLRMFRILRGERISLLAVTGTICLLLIAVAAIFMVFELGVFDKMLVRFSSDNGSAMTRYAAVSLLSHFDWYELVLGPDPARAAALQSTFGLKYGVEDFWISCIAQYGILTTALLTLGLAGLFTEILKRAAGSAWLILLLVIIVAASSVSFSSKNIQLAQFVVLIALLLPREHTRPQTFRPRGQPRLLRPYAWDHA